MAASQHNSKKHILHNQANDPWATTSRNKPGSNNKAKHTANNRGLYSLFGVQLWGSPWCEESPVSSSSSPPFSMLKVDIPSPTVSGRRQDKAVVLPLTGKNHWNLPKSFSFQSKHILMCLFVSCFFFNYYYLFWVALQSCSAFTLWRRLRATRLTQVLLGNNYVLLSCSTQLVHTVRGGAAVLTSVRHLEDLWISRVGVHRL